MGVHYGPRTEADKGTVARATLWQAYCEKRLALDEACRAVNDAKSALSSAETRQANARMAHDKARDALAKAIEGPGANGFGGFTVEP